MILDTYNIHWKLNTRRTPLHCAYIYIYSLRATTNNTTGSNFKPTNFHPIPTYYQVAYHTIRGNPYRGNKPQPRKYYARPKP